MNSFVGRKIPTNLQFDRQRSTLIMKFMPQLKSSNAAEFLCPPFQDDRGAFINLICLKREAFNQYWGDRQIRQVNLSTNSKKGTLRGLHFQRGQFSEAKIVRCLRGRVFDVIIDLRAESAGYLKVKHFVLDATEGNSVFVPEGHAHGFQTLEADSEVLYIHSKDRNIEAEAGLRWNDPELAITWPLEPTVMSERDSKLPYLNSL